MSVDRSLRVKSTLQRHRNVLSRAERVAILQDQEKFRDDQTPLGLPKVSHRKPKAGGGKKKKAAEEKTEEKE
jgi:small basic protein (TIGR04137 family)